MDSTLPGWAQPLAPPASGAREMLAHEAAHLSRLRDEVTATGVDPRDANDVGALYDHAHANWYQAGAATDPGSIVLVLGVALGDLLVSRVPGARWVVWTEPSGDAPAVTVDGHSVVLPLDEVEDRWNAGYRGWLPTFAAEKVAELRRPDEPQWDPAAPASYAPAPAHRAEVPQPRTPSDVAHPPSWEAQDLALRALEHAVDAVVPQGGPLAPFAMVHDGVQVHWQQFDGDHGQAQVQARLWVRGSGGLRAAVAWAGRLAADGEQHDAVFVEASDRGRPGIVVAHRFVDRPGAAQALGEPVILEQPGPLL